MYKACTTLIMLSNFHLTKKNQNKLQTINVEEICILLTKNLNKLMKNKLMKNTIIKMSRNHNLQSKFHKN